MIVYWYHEGKVNELIFHSLSQVTSLFSPILINSQVYIPFDGGSWGTSNPANQWYQVNARNRLVNVPMDVCKELQAALLLMGVTIHE